jgi:hypothetical protein
MRQASPLLTEQAAELKQHRQHEHDGREKPRLQLLPLLARGHAPTRQEAARLLVVHRNTMARGLAISDTGGLQALLATDVPAGKPISPAPEVLASIAQALHRPEGFASYEALRP